MSPERDQATYYFKYTHIYFYGVLKPTFKEKKIYKSSESSKGESTTRSKTPGKLVNSRYKQVPSLFIGSLISWEHLYKFDQRYVKSYKI